MLIDYMRWTTYEQPNDGGLKTVTGWLLEHIRVWSCNKIGSVVPLNIPRHILLSEVRWRRVRYTERSGKCQGPDKGIDDRYIITGARAL